MMADKIGYSQKDNNFQSLINQYDTDKDGKLNISEFRAIMQEKQKASAAAALADAANKKAQADA